uniref:Uncharacterized protein n=1 Tax=Rhizophora mucronata TaxID=61149 RepID=A0A2P2PSH8_RHIMU
MHFFSSATMVKF